MLYQTPAGFHHRNGPRLRFIRMFGMTTPPMRAGIEVSQFSGGGLEGEL
jgi:hypothetical protein